MNPTRTEQAHQRGHWRETQEASKERNGVHSTEKVPERKEKHKKTRHQLLGKRIL